MSLNRFHLAIFALATVPCAALAWEPGVYPQAPARMSTSSFSVDNEDRNDVISFWYAVYQASEGYQDRVGWNGNYTGSSGITSAVFVDDVERRLNYFRAMCGVPSDATVNSGSKVLINLADAFKPAATITKSSAAQKAALLLVRNYNSSTGVDLALTHNPGPALIGWSPAAWNALSKGNFAFGLYGPGAIKGYLVERAPDGSVTSSWNGLVGHRRWCLYPKSTDFATGDQPGSSVARPPSNVFYVIQNPSVNTKSLSAEFVAFPPAGFFPAAINSPHWSLSREGADFSFATVKMTDSVGNPVALANIYRDKSYGDPAIVWQVPDSVASTFVANDTRFHVAISGIVGDGISSTYEYDVTLIDPNRITSNQALKGPSKMSATGSAKFKFTVPPHAEGLQIAAYKRESSPWIENAELTKEAAIIGGVGDNYALFAKPAGFSGFGPISGIYSFHLTFPTSYDPILRGVPQQFFQIDRDIIAKTSAKLSFKFRRGYMTPGSTLAVEKTSDAGVSWQLLGPPITGVSLTRVDPYVSTISFNLPTSAKPVRVRFRYFTNGGAIYTHEASPSMPTGIFIDEITTTNCDWLRQAKANFISASSKSFTFNSIKAGQTLAGNQKWILALRTKLGGRWFPNGPVKQLSITP